MLSPDDLQAGSGLMQASRQGANLLGASIAGAVVATFTSAAALAIDAFTFLASALSLALMCTSRSAGHSTEKQAAEREHPVSSGQERVEQRSLWEYLGTSRLIKMTLLLFILIGLVSGGLIEVAQPTLVRGPMQGTACLFGLILVAWGLGAFVGAIGSFALGKRKHKGIIMLLAGLLMAAMIALLPT